MLMRRCLLGVMASFARISLVLTGVSFGTVTCTAAGAFTGAASCFTGAFGFTTGGAFAGGRAWPASCSVWHFSLFASDAAEDAEVDRFRARLLAAERLEDNECNTPVMPVKGDLVWSALLGEGMGGSGNSWRPRRPRAAAPAAAGPGGPRPAWCMR